MPSFDIVSKLQMQEVHNTINNALKEISNRYDFRTSKTTIELNQKDKVINIVTEDKMKMEAIAESIRTNAAKRKIDLKAFDFKDAQPGANANLKREVKLKEGLEQDVAKKIVKTIKDAKLKVQVSIQGEEVRVSGKKIDDLQEVIALLKSQDFGVPLQFENMKS